MSEPSHAPGVSLAEHLQQLTATLAATHAQEEVLAAALWPAMTALNALAGAVLLLAPEGQHLSVAAVQGSQAKTLWQDGPLSPETPAGDALLNQAPLYFEQSGSLKAAYPHLEEQTGGIAAVATAVMPLLLEGQPLGVLILDFKDPHTFTFEEKQFLTSLASQCSVALGRARLLDRLQSSEAAFRRLIEISPVGMGIGSLDGQLTLVNDAWLQLLGQTRAAFESGDVNWQALTPPEYAEIEQRAFETVLTQGGAFSYDKEMLTPTGERVPFRATMARFDDHQVVGYALDLRPFQAQQRLLEEEGTRLERLVQERTAALLAEEMASQAFVTFTEAAAKTDDLEQLVQLAMHTLEAILPGSVVGLYIRAASSWILNHWNDRVDPALRDLLRTQGLPLDLSLVVAAERTQDAVFVDRAAIQALEMDHTEPLQAGMIYPILRQGQVRMLLSVALEMQPALTALQKATLRALGRSFTLLYGRIAAAEKLQRQKEEAEQRARALEAFEQLSRDLMSETDRYALIRRAQEIVLSLLPSGLAVYYELEADLWRVKAQVSEMDVPELQVYLNRGLPATAPSPHLAWTTGEPLYQDDYAQGSDVPPEASQSLKATVTLALRIRGQPIGIFSVGLFEQRTWTAVDRMILNTAVQSLELALDRAEQTRRLEEERAGLAAFAAFAEAVGVEPDVPTLARQAVDVLQATLPNLTVAYYERVQDHWVGRVWSDELPAEVVAQVQAGVPVAAPDFAQAVQSGAPVFINHWDAQENDLSEATMYGSAAFLPLVVEGQAHSLLSVGKQSSASWSEREQVIVRAVGQGLGQALERLEAARQVQQQRDEAESRAQALEAFAVLSRDLMGETSRYALVRRAQEIMLSLLTPGYALYWEQAPDRWELKSQVGDIGDPALQRLVDEQGLPLDTPALHSTWLTGAPNYQDHYAQGADTPAELIRHVQAATAFRVEVQGEPVGMLAIGLFDQRTWTPMDKAVLETAIYSLGLLLERARSLEALADQTVQLEVANAELQASNEELEAFTYSASHDLRTPVRHVMGFAELAEKAIAKGQYDKVGQSLAVVKQGALRMTSLIDGMLVLSRSGRQELKVRSVDLNALVTQARRDAATEFGSHPVHWQIGELPTVRGDPQLLQQVMTNLLSNAVKYSAKREVSEVEVWCEESASDWTVRVQDNGAGFDPDYAQKLFGIFQRLHTEREFKGTGVGLATVRRIVQKHGGRVFAESDGRTGATFGFTLPKPS